ncbi:MAG: YeeE/YedE family protein, partial [Proteobacteria bacterium]|nr:YeeE/YedE family protein [Pseudomonadota bacterium]
MSIPRCSDAACTNSAVSEPRATTTKHPDEYRRQAREEMPGESFGIVSLLVMVGVTAVSAITHLWVLTAVPIGFLFGFFLERSDLCGASAFSEVVVMRDWRKFFGIWIVIVVSMVVFALGDVLGLVHLNPKPLFWASALLGGVVFGVGIVLAGGCISGVLFKAGQGNLNSMAALVGVPLGIASVLYGPLHGTHLRLRTMVVEAADGQVPTLSTVTGVPYWLLALVFAVATLVVTIVIMRRRGAETTSLKGVGHRLKSALAMNRGWKPWQSGIAIGILSIAAYVSSAESGRNYPLGTAEGVVGLAVMAVDAPDEVVWQTHRTPPSAANSQFKVPPTTSKSSPKRVVLWMVLLVVMMVVGSHLSARLR